MIDNIEKNRFFKIDNYEKLKISFLYLIKNMVNKFFFKILIAQANSISNIYFNINISHTILK